MASTKVETRKLKKTTKRFRAWRERLGGGAASPGSNARLADTGFGEFAEPNCDFFRTVPILLPELALPFGSPFDPPFGPPYKLPTGSPSDRSGPLPDFFPRLRKERFPVSLLNIYIPNCNAVVSDKAPKQSKQPKQHCKTTCHVGRFCGNFTACSPIVDQINTIRYHAYTIQNIYIVPIKNETWLAGLICLFCPVSTNHGKFQQIIRKFGQFTLIISSNSTYA